MSNRDTYDVVDSKGVVKEYALGMKPVTAASRRLHKDTRAEVFSGNLVVNPLHKTPSLKHMVDQMNRSGQLASRMRAAQNLQLAEDGDPAFEGYDRNWLERNFLSEFEADYVYASVRPREDATAPSTPPATPPPAPTAEPPPPPPEAAA